MLILRKTQICKYVYVTMCVCVYVYSCVRQTCQKKEGFHNIFTWKITRERVTDNLERTLWSEQQLLFVPQIQNERCKEF